MKGMIMFSTSMILPSCFDLNHHYVAKTVTFNFHKNCANVLTISSLEY